MREEYFLQVGKYKGEWDFSVRQPLDWTQDDLDNFRAMTMAAIGVFEEGYRNNQQAFRNMDSQAKSSHEALSSDNATGVAEGSDANE